MASLSPLPPPNPSSSNPERSRALNKIPPFFTKIPSWISLSSSAASSSSSSPLPFIRKDKNQKGFLENLHLVSLSKQGRFHEARQFLSFMDSSGILIGADFYKILFESCGAQRSLHDGRFFHQHMLKNIGRSDSYGVPGDCLLRMYFDCAGFDDARKLFEEMPNKRLNDWGIMISGYAENGLFHEAIALFYKMKSDGFRLEPTIITCLLRASSTALELELGRQIHSYVVKTGLVPDVSVDTELVNLYVKCGCLESSALLLDHMVESNVVAWTSLMVGYTQAGRQVEALVLFDRMMQHGVELDHFVFSIVLKACSALEDREAGWQVHGCIIKLGMDSDVSAGTPIVDFYVKCGSIGDACNAFDRISQPNEVSWSAIITGYAQVDRFEECFEIFRYLRSRDMLLNSFIYTSLFQVCAALADPNSGSQLHADALKRGLVSKLYGESALVTMYSRSGNLDYARRTFELIAEPDTVAWTAIIAGCAYHGRASEALELFKRMQSHGVKPNSITFIGILNACSHSGLIFEAREYLDSMSKFYRVKPTVDHYNCMVDVYCRAGQLEEAFKLIDSGSFEPDALSWKILLGGCTTHQNVDLGKIAGENYLKMEPEDAAAYVLTFNMYASAGRWAEAASIRKMMNGRGVKKEVSCSWITVKDK
ncbi:Pentatricopeptide repeat-containing protein, chloroplastic [Cocos nucifera]|uniref:Pentatricopeptide repeat-containing protein, chloroplastic n=1 Tax=Cocos nucifera TaxID=13894 RepID=A0A8K0MXL6_COCNU|nr:Pentatricopeptide repeat-containing protein, chloroplastic [Cocos nucifera]